MTQRVSVQNETDGLPSEKANSETGVSIAGPATGITVPEPGLVLSLAVGVGVGVGVLTLNILHARRRRQQRAA
ncbi:MAG: hypothetical protein ACI8W3_002817 [Myxococcota bacterium]